MTAPIHDIFFARLYRSTARFANIERFIAALPPDLDLTAPATDAGAVVCLKTAAAAMRPAGPIHDDASASRVLVADDLLRIAHAPPPGPVLPVAAATLRDGAEIMSRLRDVGLAVPDDTGVHVVDEYPAPFAHVALAAFTPGSAACHDHGISPGIYLKRDRLRPFYSSTLVAHELVHTVTGRIDPDVTVKGLEEGVAELVGTCFGAIGTVPVDALRNILRHGRRGTARMRLWSIYGDHLDQAALLYRDVGMDGIVAAINNGRRRLHQIEDALVAGELRQLDLPRGCWISATSELLDAVGAALPRSYVLGPLECLLVDHVAEARTAAEVAERAGVPVATAAPVLARAAATSGLFVMDGDIVTQSNVERYRATETRSGQVILRYLPPE